jgi:hypothetical protein
MPSGTRQKIIEYLSVHGPVKDPSGKATTALKELIGFNGNQAGFVQLVATMGKSGELVRDVRGKRTYELGVPNDSAARPDSSAEEHSRARAAIGTGNLSGNAIDYDELAAALLSRVVRSISEPEKTVEPTAWAQRRLQGLESRSTVLERALASARAELKVVSDERDALQTSLEAAEHNLSLLTERMGTPRSSAKSAASRLAPDDRALLHRLTSDDDAGRRSQRAG